MDDVKRPHVLLLPIKMIWIAIIMLAIFHFTFSVLNKHYGFSFDTHKQRCIPEYSFYFLNKQFKTINKGSIYMFHAKNMTPFFKDGQLIGKYVIAKSGDTVEINKNGLFVNGIKFRDRKFYLTKKLNISEGSLYKTIQLRDNEIFFAGTADNSFDSVYWGVGNTSQIIAKAIPLW